MGGHPSPSGLLHYVDFSHHPESITLASFFVKALVQQLRDKHQSKDGTVSTLK